jgi:hypothetical protein
MGNFFSLGIKKHFLPHLLDNLFRSSPRLGAAFFQPAVG